VEGASSFSDSVALHSAHDGRLYEKKLFKPRRDAELGQKKKGSGTKIGGTNETGGSGADEHCCHMTISRHQITFTPQFFLYLNNSHFCSSSIPSPFEFFKLKNSFFFLLNRRLLREESVVMMVVPAG
jgi:hypothetical protein